MSVPAISINILHEKYTTSVSNKSTENTSVVIRKTKKTRTWANAQHDGRHAEHRWRPLFNAAKFG